MEDWILESAKQIMRYFHEAEHPGYWDVARIIKSQSENHQTSAPVEYFIPQTTDGKP